MYGEIYVKWRFMEKSYKILDWLVDEAGPIQAAVSL